MGQVQLEQVGVAVSVEKLERELAGGEWEALQMQAQKVIANAQTVAKNRYICGRSPVQALSARNAARQWLELKQIEMRRLFYPEELEHDQGVME